MKIFLTLLIIGLLSPFITASEKYVVIVSDGKKQGFLKYKGVHSGTEVVAISNDIGSAWHSENLEIYFRNKQVSRRFEQQLIIHFKQSGFRQFRCKIDRNKLVVESRDKKEADFTHFCSLTLPS